MEESHAGFSEEDIYDKIEETVLSIPEVSSLTTDGLQNIVQGITSAFGKKVHRGILIRHNKARIEINIFVSLVYGCKISEIGHAIQRKVSEQISSLLDDTELDVNVIITDIIR